MGWSKSQDFWRRVKFLREKQIEQIKIKKGKIAQIEKALEGSTPAPYDQRNLYEFIRRPPEQYDPTPEEWPHPDYDTPYASIYEYARAIRKLELADAKRKACTRSISMVAVARGCELNPKDSGKDDGAAPAYGPTRPGVLPISHDEWEARGYSIQSIPEGLVLRREDRDLLANILATSPGRPNGRPPIGDKAMTSTERSRKHRKRKKESVDD